MTTLTEIETAAAALSLEQKEALLLFLAKRLRVEGAALPAVRLFGREQVEGWIAEDEADGAELDRGA